jgi:hypothetical protein
VAHFRLLFRHSPRASEEYHAYLIWDCRWAAEIPIERFPEYKSAVLYNAVCYNLGKTTWRVSDRYERLATVVVEALATPF